MRIRCFIPVTPITHYKPDISVSNKTVNIRIKVIWGAFFQPLQQRKSNKYYIFRQCVCVFLALGTQCEILMNNILICGLSGCTIFFNIIPQILRFSEKKKVTDHKTCFNFLYNFGWNITQSKKKWARYNQICILVFMLSDVILARVSWNLNFLDSVSNQTPKQNVMKIRPVGAELFHAGGHTDRHELSLFAILRTRL
jgi:hypothetical protein